MPGQATLSRRSKGLSPALPVAESAEDGSGHLILSLVAVSLSALAPDVELTSLYLYGAFCLGLEESKESRRIMQASGECFSQLHTWGTPVQSGTSLESVHTQAGSMA